MLSAALGVIISSKSSLIGVIRMKELMTQEVIKAPPSVVWDRLTESSNYSHWNDFIKRFEGDPLDGNRLRVSFKIPDKKGFRYFNYRPHVVKADPEKELRWVGNPYLFGFVFSGEHYFVLRPMKDGNTEFLHGEIFKGILLPIMWNYLTTFYRSALIEFNRSLRKICESPEADEAVLETGQEIASESR